VLRETYVIKLKQSGAIHSLFFEGSGMSIIETIEMLIKPTVESHGLRVVEVVLAVEYGEKFLRIALEKPGGSLLLDDIVLMTQLLNPILDESKLMQEHYILDITSPGAEHPIPLQELDHYINTYIQLSLLHAVSEHDVILGTLKRVDEASIELQIKQKTVSKTLTILRKDIKKASTAIKV
jgi:ribosome maturation factor RimP